MYMQWKNYVNGKLVTLIFNLKASVRIVVSC